MMIFSLPGWIYGQVISVFAGTALLERISISYLVFPNPGSSVFWDLISLWYMPIFLRGFIQTLKYAGTWPRDQEITMSFNLFLKSISPMKMMTMVTMVTMEMMEMMVTMVMMEMMTQEMIWMMMILRMFWRVILKSLFRV